MGRETSSPSSYFAYSYSPWLFLQQVAEALLRFLGFRSSDETEATTHFQPQSKSTKEIEVGSRSIAVAPRLNKRRPPRPPVSSGGGGKTN